MAKYTEWLTDEGLVKIEGWARDGLTDEQISKNIGISRSTLNKWKKDFPDISDTLKRGKEVVDRQVENALFKSATGYNYAEITEERIIDTGQKKRHNGESKLTQEEWEICVAYFDNQCAYCGNSNGMTKDHLDPLKNGGELTFTNVVPACKSCNSSKKDHQWLAWYQKQDFYKSEYAKKISDYIKFTLLFPKKESDDILGELVVTKQVTKQVAPNPTSAIFWLKNRKPEVWRDRREIDSGDEGKQQAGLEWAAMVAEAEKELGAADG